MNNKIKEFLYLTINKIKGVYKRDVDDIFNVICDYINSAPYEVFKEIKYCDITAFDEGCSIGNVTRGEVNLLIKKPDFYCARVILAAVEQIEKYFGPKVDVSISYRLVNINIL